MIRTVKPVKAHMLQGGHVPKAVKRFCPKLSVYRSKAYRPNLSEADTRLKWT